MSRADRLFARVERRHVAFDAKPLNKAGYVPIDTKGKSIQVYAKCEGGNTKPKGKTIGHCEAWTSRPKRA